jgi:glycerophosphoryl diester phosphodiesterase
MLALTLAPSISAERLKAAEPVPLPQAHAHNDYLHQRPLLDALDHGFCSVEADIFLVDGQLLVAHERSELTPERTLAGLYLDPLRERVRAGGGRVWPDGPPFTLLIDIKSEAEPTYRELHDLLAQYQEMLTTVRDGRLDQKAVTVIISGNRPRELMLAQPIRFAGLDGRVEDLNSTLPSHALPLISDRWGKLFTWTGEGPMPADQRARLDQIVAGAHAAGRRVRFWATPERVALWRALDEAGVDLINTDDLAGLQAFLSTRQ